MRHAPATVSPFEPISIVIDKMIKERTGAIVVVEDKLPVGIITERDVLERVIKPQKDFELTPVKDAMSKPLITIEADRSIKEALDLMREHNIRRLIVTKNGEIIGLTTERRLLEVAHTRFLMKNYNVIKSKISYTLNKRKIGFVSTYPPRECGIATYTKDLVDAISSLYILSPPIVIAINDKGSHYNYESWVKYQIDRERFESYIDAAEYINDSDIDIINLQHEFGLFGGEWGEYVIKFLERLEKPVITTLHTVLLEPDPKAKMVMERILENSDYVIVMARVGVQIMEQFYGTLTDKVRYIPHGCPNVPFTKGEAIKGKLGLQDRITLSTFGLLSRGKGIEYAIKALPAILKEEPQILYLIIGETHPEVRKHEGEEYREHLAILVESLGLEKNVRFVNRFLSKNELIRYLQATDIYVIPYPNKEQISSGTLMHALSTGKAIISTPFLQAEEVISEGCAMECGFRDPGSIADCVRIILQNDDIRNRLEKRAYEYSRFMIWPHVAMRHVNLFYEVLGV